MSKSNSKGLTRISHKISSKGMQDGASDLFSPGREHYQRDKGSPGENKGDVADCADLPRGCEKSGLIRRDMTIEEILSFYPQKGQKIAQELTNAGLSCVGCGAATWETLEAGVLGHGYDENTLNELIDSLNTIIAEETNADTIQMTKKAAEKFLEILKAENKKGWALRFGDKPGGCGGYEYILDYSEKAAPEDTVFHSHGVDIHINEQMVARLLGSEIDYHDGLQGAGFKVSNPNVKSSCSCGSSQSY